MVTSLLDHSVMLSRIWLLVVPNQGTKWQTMSPIELFWTAKEIDNRLNKKHCMRVEHWSLGWWPLAIRGGDQKEEGGSFKGNGRDTRTDNWPCCEFYSSVSQKNIHNTFSVNSIGLPQHRRTDRWTQPSTRELHLHSLFVCQWHRPLLLSLLLFCIAHSMKMQMTPMQSIC